MKILGSLMIPLSFAFVLGLSAGKAEAEGFIFVTAGGAFTEDDKSFQFEDSVSIEAGGGAWFSLAKFLDIGFQAGLGYYGPTVETPPGVDDLDFQLLPLTVLATVRVPLFHSDRLPHGLLQPYAAIGPSFLLSVIDIDLLGETFVGFDVGLDFRAGVNVNLTNRLALFAQYRRTSVDASLEGDGFPDIDVDFVSDHVTAGFGVHF